MRLNMTQLVMVALCAMMAGMVIAAEPQTQSQQPAMPVMGPPAEMKQLAFLEGTWDVAMKMNMSQDPKVEQWVDLPGTATFKYILDGAAMQSEQSFSPMMPGTPGMKGLMVQTYDRETKQWQASWVDNMFGRTAIYSGTRGNGQMVVQGEDMMGGQKYLSRISSSNETPTRFEWKMEYSLDGGKTWATSGTAVYTKKA